jgi:3-oxoadipate enol-lactonase
VSTGGAQARAAVALAYDVQGPAGGPPVVLVHSIGTDREVWRDHVAPLTAAGYLVIRVDLRGHGRSPVPGGPYAVGDLGTDVLALLDRLGVHRADVVGVSIGGAVGLWLAAEAADRVGRLVVCCSAAWFGGPDVWGPRGHEALLRGTAALVDATVSRWFTPSFRAEHDTRVEPVRRTFRATDPVGYAGCAAALAALDLRPELPRVVAPTLVIAGAHDEATPLATSSAPLADHLPNARLRVVDAAHLAPYERPDLVVPLVLDHLEPTRSGP